MTKNTPFFFCLITLTLTVLCACATDRHFIPPTDDGNIISQQDAIGQKVQWLEDAMKDATPETKQICDTAEKQRHTDSGADLGQCCFYYVCVDWMKQHREDPRKCLTEFNGTAPHMPQ